MDALKPCPFCGSTDLRIMGGIGKYVKCRICEASSGHLPGGACTADERTAVQAWNTRYERTCTMVESDFKDFAAEYEHLYVCSVCEESTACLECISEDGDTDWVQPKFCSLCGSKVVER